MPLMTTTLARQQISKGETAPLYMLVGADDLEKSAFAAEFAEAVEEDLRPFNVTRLFGNETKVDDLMDCAQTLPMMSPRRIVIVAEAEKLLTPKRESKAAEAEQERLETFLQTPPPHATIVFVCGALDMRRRVAKLLVKEAHVVDCGTIQSAADAERWVKARALREKITIDQAAVNALMDRAGLDIVRLRAGLERVAMYTMGQPSITADDVRQVVTAGPEAQVDFGVAKAIWRNDSREALRELALALDNGAVPVMVMGQLRSAAEKLPASRVNRGIEAVFRTDLALKSSAGDARVLLERLVVELCASAPSKGSSTRAPSYRRY
jgi:DNA polymerase-3 subunit delta